MKLEKQEKQSEWTAHRALIRVPHLTLQFLTLRDCRGLRGIGFHNWNTIVNKMKNLTLHGEINEIF